MDIQANMPQNFVALNSTLTFFMKQVTHFSSSVSTLLLLYARLEFGSYYFLLFHLTVNTENFDAGFQRGLVNGFLKTDSLFNEKAQFLGINDGSTAMALFLREDSVIVANCGDSSGFICRKPYI